MDPIIVTLLTTLGVLISAMVMSKKRYPRFRPLMIVAVLACGVTGVVRVVWQRPVESKTVEAPTVDTPPLEPERTPPENEPRESRPRVVPPGPESTVTPSAPGPVPEDVSPIKVTRFDFSDVGHWPISGSTRVSSGKLAVTVGPNEWVWLTLPGVQATENFTVQAEMTLVEGHFCASRIGFGLGSDGEEQNAFMTMGDCTVRGRIGFFAQRGLLFESASDMRLVYNGERNIVGLEVRGKIATVLFNGSRTETGSIERQGRHVSLVAWKEGTLVPRSSTFTFDNVVYRPEP